MKKSFLLSFIGAFILSAVFLACPFLAAETAATSTSTIDVGNKMCPVSGDKVSGKDFVEHQGKKYGLCCPMCAKDFKKDPQKYIARLNSKMEVSEEGAVSEVKVTQAAGGVSEEEPPVSMVSPPLPTDQAKPSGEIVTKADAEPKKAEANKEKRTPQMYYN